MADEAQLSPFVFACQGGLVLDQSTFAMQPGMALELQNFEPDISGGYRRISGYAKWNSNIVPQTASSTEPVLMVALFNSKVIAARGTKIFEAGTTGSWSEIDTGRTNAGRYTFFSTISQEQILSYGQTALTTLLSMTAAPLQTSMHLAHQLIQSL